MTPAAGGTRPGAITPRTVRAIAALLALLIASSVPVAAQDKPDNWLMRLARGAAAAAIEADMAGAQFIDLEAAALSVPYGGAVVFGIAGLELKETVGLRLKAYLYNPSEEAAAVPLPVITQFVLVDQLGRRLEAASLSVERVERNAKQLTVPALERLAVEMLFLPPQPTAETGVLKVAGAGVIRGIPLTAPAPAAVAGAPAAAFPSAAVSSADVPEQRYDPPPSAPASVPPTSPPQPQQPLAPGVSHPLVGSWSRGTIAAHVAGTGSVRGGYADGFLYTFHPDGRYEFSGIMEAAGAGRILMYAAGRYLVEGTRLTIAREGGTFINQTSGSEKPLAPETRHFEWRIESDPYGTRPVLKLLVPGLAEDIFYRRED